jgi:hypothetical protein
MKYKYFSSDDFNYLYMLHLCWVLQVSTSYGGIDTENVLSYKVDEIIVMRFGGSSTHYNVSGLETY